MNPKAISSDAIAMNPHAAALIQQFSLIAHPEGGFYRETYRAPLQVQSPVHAGLRPAFTSIHFLLANGHYSAWHRVASDESWFFHTGCDLQIYTLTPPTEHNHCTAPSVNVVTLGPGVGRYETTIAAGNWFAAKPVDDNSYCFVSCVVGPGFLFEDFQLADRDTLIAQGYEKTSDWPMIESFLVRQPT